MFNIKKKLIIYCSAFSGQFFRYLISFLVFLFKLINYFDCFFPLVGKNLYYYTKEDESKLQGVVDLIGCKLSEVAYSRDEPDKWLFEISHGNIYIC